MVASSSSQPGDSVLALDVGGTKLAAAVVTPEGDILAQRRTPSRVERGPEAMIAEHLALAELVLQEAGVPRSQLLAAGVACGGPLDVAAGVVTSPPNLPGWHDVPLARLVSRTLGIPAIVDNDATAAALAELWYGWGATRGVANIVYLTVSTGVGGGLILGGKPFRGVGGNAGELGHVCAVPGGRRCGCGRTGCLEAYVSGSAIAARAREAVAGTGQAAGSVLAQDRAAITAQTVARAAAAGDGLAARLWDETTQILGAAVADVLNTFNPDLVVLGGGVTRSGDLLLEPVRRTALSQALPPARAAGDVVLTELGDDIGVLGAAALAVEHHRASRPANGPDGPGQLARP